jgi:hypothetical protein
MSILTPVWRFLSVARLPRVAAGFTDNGIVLLEVKKRRNQFTIERMATAALPKALLRADFSASNIAEAASLANIIKQTCDRAGLKRESRWSISLPEGVAKSRIINFDSKPESREEMEETLAWKVERVIGIERSRLRIVRQQINNEGLPRFFVSVVEEGVIAEYEAVFQLLGWHAGLIMPRHMSEASWLARDSEPGDKLLVSYNAGGFVAVGLRSEAPIMVRVHDCGLDDRENELFHFATYYREKVLQPGAGLLRVLVIGEQHETELTERTFADAFGDIKFFMLTSAQLSLNIPDAGINFSQIAATAGAAAMAY